MEIRVGSYIIKSDQFNIWIEKTYGKDEEGKKIKSRRICGYHRKWEECIEDFINRETGKTDAKSVTEVLQAIEQARKEAVEMSLAAYEKGKGYRL